MQNRKLLLTLGISVAAIAVATAVLRAQSPETPTGSAHANALNSKEAVLPTVDYYEPELTDADQRARRKARGKRYDGSMKVAEPHPEAGAKGILDSWMQRLPAFPVEVSDAIIVGGITNAQAYLSPDKTGIYTEYMVHVEKVLKQYAEGPIIVGGLVDTQREGGRVRFPSGRVQSYITHYQGVPLIGRKYALFLKRNEDGETFNLITGYEQRDGRIYPLDGVNLTKGATEIPQFAVYKGVDEASFSRDLRVAISQPEQAPKE